jgi:hypothetical protein
MRPKLLARIARFEAALEDKARFATKSWTDVAHEFGYYDQMHLVHDFGEFTGRNSDGNAHSARNGIRSANQDDAIGCGFPKGRWQCSADPLTASWLSLHIITELSQIPNIGYS